MPAARKALRVVVFPFQAARFLILIANFLAVSAVCLLVASFVAYGVALAFSYGFLPPEWTQALWQWAQELYERLSWFRAATIVFFTLLFLPILRFWPARDSVADAAREGEITRLNDGLIARAAAGPVTSQASGLKGGMRARCCAVVGAPKVPVTKYSGGRPARRSNTVSPDRKL
ncbi:Hypothetical protein NGAL_HAMBI1145_53170 [Neorhizobium galegae bv. officinalis]|uniref:Uncharacterized protein n=1 Tax=Neorhizobium galegae bv. officinalis TaxID=323656 RepID=A0A0T7FZ66_NEOGA|nr:hypothetical protein [Neorhizobium galegae]CDZ40284.1 Hypothetical protein NGAL_HAMBI1145_53170 [Neorhizobium galegae bv. officinalis]